ncbi:MAG TPA: hypothetical protein PLX97_11340, partial [Gemmatales bacterium]|nr:hypothetical protein [Gemmatales bacterium]
MLTSRTIPQHETDHADWHRFLYKAAAGSIKAVDIVEAANRAFMVALTDDPTSPSTWHLNEYANLFRERFPSTPPCQSTNELVTLACQQGWFPQPFHGEDRLHQHPEHYQKLWIRSRNVNWVHLANDALFSCLQNWSADDCLTCLEETACDYDSRKVVSSMLYLALTWP